MSIGLFACVDCVLAGNTQVPADSHVRIYLFSSLHPDRRPQRPHSRDDEKSVQWFFLVFLDCESAVIRSDEHGNHGDRAETDGQLLRLPVFLNARILHLSKDIQISDKSYRSDWSILDAVRQND
jgi:hypothetical protein